MPGYSYTAAQSVGFSVPGSADDENRRVSIVSLDVQSVISSQSNVHPHDDNNAQDEDGSDNETSMITTGHVRFDRSKSYNQRDFADFDDLRGSGSRSSSMCDHSQLRDTSKPTADNADDDGAKRSSSMRKSLSQGLMLLDDIDPVLEVSEKESALLLLDSQAPQWMRHTRIYSGYRRPGLSNRQIFRSLFRWHNETMNIWTHLIVVLALVVFAPWIFMEISPFPFQAQVSIIVYLFGSVCCFYLSSRYHLICCRSRQVMRQSLVWDQIGTLAYICSSFLPGMTIVGMRFPVLGQRCKLLAVINFIVGAYLISRGAKNLGPQASSSADRVYMFTTLWSLVPYFLYAYSEYDVHDMMGKKFSLAVVIVYVNQVLAFLMYRFGFPERVFSRKPGSNGKGGLDCFGNSHNLMHIMVSAGGLIWLLFVWWVFRQAVMGNYGLDLIDEVGFQHVQI